MLSFLSNFKQSIYNLVIGLLPTLLSIFFVSSSYKLSNEFKHLKIESILEYLLYLLEYSSNIFLKISFEDIVMLSFCSSIKLIILISSSEYFSLLVSTVLFFSLGRLK